MRSAKPAVSRAIDLEQQRKNSPYLKIIHTEFFHFQAFEPSGVTGLNSALKTSSDCTMKSCEKVALPSLHVGFQVIDFRIWRSINVRRFSTFLASSYVDT